jgi:positive regulator of sigma E activity
MGCSTERRRIWCLINWILHVSQPISHLGLVTNYHDDKAVIQLVDFEACEKCSLSGLCGIEKEDKSRLEIVSDSLHIGDTVNVQLIPRTGLNATFWAYFLPFLLVIFVLVLSLSLQWPEGISGMLALCTIPIYYVGLSLFRKQIAKVVRLKVFKV